MTFERGSNLSAEAAAFGGQAAIGLSNSGSYSETLTGDYAVSDTLPPSDQSVFWQTFTQISLNGTPFFTGNAIVGPESQNDIWSAILSITGLTPAQLAILKAVLVNHNVLNTGGEFDYAYNFATGDRTVGTFAVGSDKDLTSTEDFGPYVDPFAASAFESISVPDGPNVWSLTFSATVTTIPEPATWLMLMAGGAGVLLVRGLGRRVSA
ncbi:MAG TPA: PEP-CTERM sorting domain-containing protein [Roseiarcus sp.]